MARYQGINEDNGEERGPYRVVVLETPLMPFVKEDYLRQNCQHPLGYRISKYFRTHAYDMVAEGLIEEGQRDLFHYAGATVSFEEIVNKKTNKIKVRLSFVSNDSLDDVVKKMRKHFPTLKRSKPKSLRSLVWH